MRIQILFINKHHHDHNKKKLFFSSDREQIVSMVFFFKFRKNNHLFAGSNSLHQSFSRKRNICVSIISLWASTISLWPGFPFRSANLECLRFFVVVVVIFFLFYTFDVIARPPIGRPLASLPNNLI
jgi:hypothetical protein